ncbi:HAD-IA family hydrolase [Streptomyces europaeiscabiei]|uniref:HAD-IA family hydrolase n=1 Tax=Streptomyces europaeiscabiei TaxID=146819 RepID=UPI0029B21287|nr:HAD-IA family hydrolase [Streptomyces europaeiscabiei]MDX3834342.1 HAD-IA family hydrolase [Streptomyces europaeiscabiei]
MAAGEPGPRALDGAAGLLRSLPPGRWAVATSSRAGPTAERPVLAGLIVPEVHVCTEDVLAGKPSPDGCLTAAARLGVDAVRCPVAEDAPAGIAAGPAADCTVYAVAPTYRREELRGAHASFGFRRGRRPGRCCGPWVAAR